MHINIVKVNLAGNRNNECNKFFSIKILEKDKEPARLVDPFLF